MLSKRVLPVVLTLLAALLVWTPLQAQSPTKPAEDVLARLMPHLAPQFKLALIARPDHRDYFRITGTAGHICVEAATQPTLLYGVNWYLKYVAQLQVSTNGFQLGAPGLTLPAPPPQPI